MAPPLICCNVLHGRHSKRGVSPISSLVSPYPSWEAASSSGTGRADYGLRICPG